MADNVEIGPNTFATDDVDGVQTQRVKVQFGGDGEATDVDHSSPLPVHVMTEQGNITSSIRGSAGERVALDVAQASALSFITVSPGTGTRYFGTTDVSSGYAANVLSSATSPDGTVDTLGYSTFTIGFVATGSGMGNMTLEGSHDGITWFHFPFEVLSNTGGTTSGSSSGLYIIGVTSTFTGALIFRYLRARTTGTVTGTYTMQVALSPTALPKNIMLVSGVTANTDDLAPLSMVNSASFQYSYGGGINYWHRTRTPTTFKTAQVSAVGATTVWTPAASRRFRLMRYRLTIPNNSTILASGGIVTIQFLDNDTVMPIAESVYLPASAGTTLGAWSTGWIDLGNGIASSAVNNPLRLEMSNVLTAGHVRVSVCGVEEL